MILDAPLQSICKCHFCTECDGTGCIGEMPGMGGFSDNVNFLRNCADWAILEEEIKKSGNKEYSKLLSSPLPEVRLAPITGGIENVGYSTEKGFYRDIVAAVYKAGCKLSIGDGCPDIKLLSGIEAVQSLCGMDSAEVGASPASSEVTAAVCANSGTDAAPKTAPRAGTQALSTNEAPRAAVFIKPYPQVRIFERMEWSAPVAEYLGIDIDSYSIVTMRNLVKLERKSVAQLIELKKEAAKRGLPFAVKGIFTKSDIDLMKEVKPDVIVISNHGGRVENRIGSTASFMAENASLLRDYCGELWVDGGIRKYRDLQTAAYFGISQVMVGRPFISALCKGGKEAVRSVYERLLTSEK